MSRWTDQFEKHVIWEAVTQLSLWAAVEVDDIDSDHESEKRRLIKVLETINEILVGLDPEVFPMDLVIALDQQLRKPVIWNEVAQYYDDQQVQHLKTANDHLSAQIPLVYQIASLAKKPKAQNTVSQLEKAYDEFCKRIEKTKNSFDESTAENDAQISKLQARTEELDGSLKSLISTTSTQIASWQKEFTEAETKRIQEHSSTQIARTKEYEETLEAIRTQSEADVKESKTKHEKALASDFSSYQLAAKQWQGEMKTKHQEILTLHGLVTTDAVAGGYKKGADEESKRAKNWSVLSMICYCLIFVWVVFKGWLGFGIAETDGAGAVGVDWPVLVTTLSVTAVVFVAAQYAGRQSRIHQMNEQRMRWFSFEIAAIDPFIANLPSEQQQALKHQLSEKLFGQDRTIEDKPSKVRGIDPSVFKEVVSSFTETVKSLTK